MKIGIFVMILFFLSGCFEEKTQATQQKNASSIYKIPKSSVAMLGVLVSYKDKKIVYSDEVWSKKLFGFEEGDLNSYYMQASAGKFAFKEVSEQSNRENDGIISVVLDQNHPNLDIDSASYEDIVYPSLQDALQKIDKYIDFSNYDFDANGYISANELIIVFIIAGYEDAYEGYHINYGTWAHQNCIDNSSHLITLDGVTLMGCQNNGNFALFGELHNQNNPHMATIGIIAHELGHATFNLPDLYNTTNPNEGGIGYFGLMGSGIWARKNASEYAGQTPTHFCAWSKMYNGWITPVTEKDTQTSLYETASDEYNVIKIPISQTSYYLLENRNDSGYDSGLHALEGNFQGGMALWKIDETKLTAGHILQNDVNSNTQAQGVTLIEAVKGDIDQGGGGNANALFYEGNKNYFQTLITDISKPNRIMSLNVH